MRKRNALALLFVGLLGVPSFGKEEKSKGPASATKTSGHKAGKKRTFSIPAWHPEARWKLDEQAFAHDTMILATALDGPRHEILTGASFLRPTLGAGLSGNGRYVFMGYDKASERMHAVTGGAAGYLDGPFSRARFYKSDYHGGHERAQSPDGRFHYLLADFYGQKIRAVDLAEQKVSTLAEKGVVFACGESGKVYVVEGINPPTALKVLSPGPEWNLIKSIKLKGTQSLAGMGSSAAVDEKNGRFYATTFRAKDYFVWYWDLKDGSFKGVLPNCTGKPNARKKGYAGPFDGTVVYNHGEIIWGPDDPDKRFLYMTRVDTHQLFRLDMKEKMLAVFSVQQGRFVNEGRGDQHCCYSTTPHWLEDGSFVGKIPFYNPGPQYRFFRRIK